ncbi:phage baseplate plug family protein [Dickeya poaceiphila]|uniref:Cyanophage baseplate Pam3 plug gp18 domain-containing protein n=1 Tax=Dickeya poaceiphila TaxID=568768 RepID=A0A5B8I4P2_9GAMM|nr:hypothetical protein [Dickeya poaceiphila]QDX29561.1 hypothetical protein Dpoa569_0001346 [Dickeya poaceiphila]
MLSIAIAAEKSQEISITLGGQSCRIKIHQRTTGLYMDLYVGEKAIMQGVICLNCNRMVRYKYLGFIGDLVFSDMEGDTDPVWDGLGSRYKLYYLEASDL